MRKLTILLFAFIFISQSCTVKYGLTGASIAADVKTVSVQYFVNRAPLGMTNLEQYFTDELKDKFKSQTKLMIVSE